MRNKITKIMIITGIVCVLASLSLFVYNKIVSDRAERFAEKIVRQLRDITLTKSDTATDSETPDDAQTYEETGAVELKTVEIDGYSFIGILSIPVLELELPVMSEWNYDNLSVAPCRYSGSPASDDFVIAAHNYSSNFGFIDRLKKGDPVTFTDLYGRRTDYRVELIDTLSSTDVKNMTAGEYDLTLFTCTPSGQARVTVRLNRIRS